MDDILNLLRLVRDNVDIGEVILYLMVFAVGMLVGGSVL